PPSRKRIWLLLLLVLLLLGGIGGAVLLNRGGGDADPDNKDSSKDAPYSFGPRSHCSDDADPKIYEPLEFGEPIAVRFDRRLLDALDPKNIPPVEVYDWQPKGLVAVLGEHRMRGPLFALSRDGKTLAVCRGDPYIRFGPVETIHEKHILTAASGVLVLAWSPDGDRLAVSGVDGVVRLYDVRDPAKIPEPVVLDRPGVLITSLSWSGDNKYLLGGDNTRKQGKAWVWDV